MRLKIREVTEKINFLNEKDWFYGFNFLGLKIRQVVKYIVLYTNTLTK